MSLRLLRINKLFQEEIARLTKALFEELSCYVTISSVESSDDFSFAKVTIILHPYSDQHKKNVIKILNKKKSQISFKIAREHHLQKIPIFKFEVYDHENNPLELLYNKINA